MYVIVFLTQYSKPTPNPHTTHRRIYWTLGITNLNTYRPILFELPFWKCVLFPTHCIQFSIERIECAINNTPRLYSYRPNFLLHRMPGWQGFSWRFLTISRFQKLEPIFSKNAEFWMPYYLAHYDNMEICINICVGISMSSTYETRHVTYNIGTSSHISTSRCCLRQRKNIKSISPWKQYSTWTYIFYIYISIHAHYRSLDYHHHHMLPILGCDGMVW